MKKILLLSTLFSFTTSFSQVWIDEGAVWHYEFWNLFTTGFYEIEYTGDTLIDGHDCQVIEGKRYIYAETDLAYFGESNLPTRYTYVSGDTVFYRVGDEFFVMMDFGADVGDSWVISTTGTEMCDDTSKVVVTETGTMLIDGTDYRTIRLEPTPNSSFGFQGVFIERFGNLSGGLAPFFQLFPTHYQCDSIDGVYEWDHAGFRCFQDNSFPLYKPGEEGCDWWRSVGVDEEEVFAFSIYPNPASNVIHVNGDVLSLPYSIYDLTGKTILSGILENQEIPIDALEQGLYLVQISEHTQRLLVE